MRIPKISIKTTYWQKTDANHYKEQISRYAWYWALTALLNTIYLAYINYNNIFLHTINTMSFLIGLLTYISHTKNKKTKKQK